MGEVFAGRYELVDLLGRGGMGDVWRAWDHRAAAYVCAKVLRQSDAASLIRFVREQTLRIAHPHVVAPRSWAAEDERVLFTMDLVRGGSVATLVGDHGWLPSPYVAWLLDQLLDALGAVHGAGVIHRDLKPANLLLEPTGCARPHLRLSDFGIAVKQGEPRLTTTSLVIGTPGYLAPEQLRGADPEPRQDLYAAGVAAIEMVTGQRPSIEEPRAIERPPTADPALWEVLRTLTAEKPDHRPGSADAARVQLARSGVRPGHDAAPSLADEPIEVFEQVPPLPAGWGPDGPVSSSGPSEALGPAEHRAWHGAPDPAPPSSGPPGSAPGPVRASGPESAPVSRTPKPRTPGPRTPGPRTPGTGLRIVRVIAAAIGLVALGVAVWAGWLQWAGDGSGSGESTTQDGEETSGSDEASPTGETCPFDEIGTRQGTEDGGIVECVFAEGEYLWDPVEE